MKVLLIINKIINKKNLFHMSSYYKTEDIIIVLNNCLKNDIESLKKKFYKIWLAQENKISNLYNLIFQNCLINFKDNDILLFIHNQKINIQENILKEGLEISKYINLDLDISRLNENEKVLLTKSTHWITNNYLSYNFSTRLNSLKTNNINIIKCLSSNIDIDTLFTKTYSKDFLKNHSSNEKINLQEHKINKPISRIIKPVPIEPKIDSQNIIIIGSKPSKIEMGKLIDSFKSNIRFNYSIIDDNNKKYYGSIHDILFINIEINRMYRAYKNNIKYLAFKDHFKNYDNAKKYLNAIENKYNNIISLDSFEEFYNVEIDKNFNIISYDYSPLFKIMNEIFTDFNIDIKYENKAHHPRAGLFGIFYAILKYYNSSPIRIYGFSLDNQYNSFYSKAETLLLLKKFHSIEKEYKIYKMLEKKGFIDLTLCMIENEDDKFIYLKTHGYKPYDNTLKLIEKYTNKKIKFFE